MKALRSEGYVTPKDYSAFVKFNLLKGKYYRVKTVLTILLVVFACAALFLVGLAKGDKFYFVLGGIVALCSLMFLYTISVNVKNTCNKSAKVIRAKQKTEFGKNGFVFEMLFQNPEENEYSEIFYDEVDHIYLAPKAIYVYIEKRSVIVIPKRNLKISPKEAHDFLQKYAPQKLVVCI